MPLSRLQVPDIRAEVIRRGLVASISDTTIWRWLSEDAIKPWTHRSWIFPRDPDFEPKAGRVLDLYAREWEGRPLRDDEYVLSADEKTSIQARRRRHASLPPISHRPQYVEHEYQRKGAWAYLAAWDVRRAKVFGRCEEKSGIAPFDRLVGQVMRQEPYRSARRVFWIMDNGSGHRGQKAVDRLRAQWPTLVPVHTPVHASWLNQIECWFSILSRQALRGASFTSVRQLRQAIDSFIESYNPRAVPFEWKKKKVHPVHLNHITLTCSTRY